MSLRRADLSQAGEIARLHRLTVRTSLTFLPDLHTPEQDLAWFRDHLMVETETWVWEEGGVICGYVAFKPG
ncbi:N-acetyltransferase family protein, partial [Phenylobacterium aquaticum]